jgi:aminodeoxyfutalosine deaminase
MPSFTLCARYVFPVARAPIPAGTVTIDGQRIVAVGRRHGGAEVRDLGNVAILPGLVNAHIHLDFSDLPAPLGEPGIAMADWIRRVLDHRQQGGDRTDAVALGLAESLRHGVTTLGEIAVDCQRTNVVTAPRDCGRGGPEMAPPSPATQSRGVSRCDISPSPVNNLTVFRELIAPTAERVAAAMELARAHLHNAARMPPNWRPALSPHAPYTVHPELLAGAIALSAADQAPLAMHLAESREELELLRHGSGPLRTLLEERGQYCAATVSPGARPLDYLRRLAGAHRALVIHGNYLDDEEIAFVGANAARMAVVYCPRTHHWFAHAAYPLEKMLAAGATVALGTDGRGSSPDLSLLAEMRLAARRHPAVGLDQILRMGTIVGAEALGWQAHVGSLEPGKQADLAIVALPDREAGDPHELLFDSAEPVVACYGRGQQIAACSS